MSELNSKKRISYNKDTIKKKQLKLSFNTFEELNELLIPNKFKITLRNTLGMRNEVEWINTFNIGNIMHLAPLTFDELNPQDYSKFTI